MNMGAEEAKRATECRAFQNGNCEKGDSCKFLHNPANAGKGDQIRNGRTLSAETMTLADVAEFYRGVLASEFWCAVCCSLAGGGSFVFFRAHFVASRTVHPPRARPRCTATCAAPRAHPRGSWCLESRHDLPPGEPGRQIRAVACLQAP